MISQYLSKKPVIPSSVFIAHGAVVVGDVEFGEDCTVWFNAVIRGDVNYVRIGNRTNIQDGAILHVTLNKHPLIMGSDITVGHGAILHGCTVHDHALIGLGARVLDRAVVRSNSIVAAGALVKEGFEVPEYTLVAGIPARVVRPLSDEEILKIERSANNYIEYARTYRSLNVSNHL